MQINSQEISWEVGVLTVQASSRGINAGTPQGTDQAGTTKGQLKTSGSEGFGSRRLPPASHESALWMWKGQSGFEQAGAERSNSQLMTHPSDAAPSSPGSRGLRGGSRTRGHPEEPPSLWSWCLPAAGVMQIRWVCRPLDWVVAAHAVSC